MYAHNVACTVILNNKTKKCCKSLMTSLIPSLFQAFSYLWRSAKTARAKKK